MNTLNEHEAGTSKAESESPPEAKSPEIIGLRPAVTGAYVTLRCRSCSHSFSGFQPTVAGVAVGQHRCPNCGALYGVGPKEFEAALDRFLPERSFEEMVAITEEATRIAESWHQREPLCGLVTYKGINLGSPTERYLMSHITLGLQRHVPPSEEAS